MNYINRFLIMTGSNVKIKRFHGINQYDIAFFINRIHLNLFIAHDGSKNSLFVNFANSFYCSNFKAIFIFYFFRT